MKVIVVGAGLGGLATALRLQGAGHDVTVLEQADAPAGARRRSSIAATRGTPAVAADDAVGAAGDVRCGWARAGGRA